MTRRWCRLAAWQRLSAAFRSGKIDGFMLSPPLPQTLERDGFGSIIIHNTADELPSLSGITYIALFTSKEFADKNPASSKGLCTGHFRSGSLD